MDKLDYGYGLILMYLVGGLAGNIYETCLNLVKRRKFVYSNGSVSTPFNFVYGIGSVAICLGLIGLKDNPLCGGIRYFFCGRKDSAHAQLEL